MRADLVYISGQTTEVPFYRFRFTMSDNEANAMILADEVPLSVAIVIAVILFGGLFFFALFLFRGYERFARRSLLRRYTGLEIHSEPQPGDVILTYHTYHGVLAWFTQTPHQVALPAADARKLLGRLLRFNLTWGMTSAGALLVLLLAIFNYSAQRRSIANQEAVGGVVIVPSAHVESSADETSQTAVFPDARIAESPSFFHRFVGWIAAALCTLFGIVTLVSLVNGEFEAVGGGVLLVILLGWVARDWLRRPETTVVEPRE